MCWLVRSDALSYQSFLTDNIGGPACSPSLMLQVARDQQVESKGFRQEEAGKRSKAAQRACSKFFGKEVHCSTLVPFLWG